MSVAVTKERLMDLLETVSGVKYVNRRGTRQIPQTPAFLVFSGRATHKKNGNDLKVITRQYEILGLIKPVEQGADTEAEQAVEPFFPLIENLFDERPGLGTDNTNAIVTDSYLVEDSGSIVLPMAGANYAACIWILEVIEMKNITPGA